MAVLAGRREAQAHAPLAHLGQHAEQDADGRGQQHAGHTLERDAVNPEGRLVQQAVVPTRQLGHFRTVHVVVHGCRDGRFEPNFQPKLVLSLAVELRTVGTGVVTMCGQRRSRGIGSTLNTNREGVLSSTVTTRTAALSFRARGEARGTARQPAPPLPAPPAHPHVRRTVQARTIAMHTVSQMLAVCSTTLTFACICENRYQFNSLVKKVNI